MTKSLKEVIDFIWGEKSFNGVFFFKERPIEITMSADRVFVNFIVIYKEVAVYSEKEDEKAVPTVFNMSSSLSIPMNIPKESVLAYLEQAVNYIVVGTKTCVSFFNEKIGVSDE